jgi:hypothetical protein
LPENRKGAVRNPPRRKAEPGRIISGKRDCLHLVRGAPLGSTGHQEPSHLLRYADSEALRPQER